MSRRWMICAAATLGLVGGAAIGQMAAVRKDAAGSAADQIPPKARAALMKYSKAGKNTEIERQQEGNLVLFKAEWKHLTRESSATVTSDGDLVVLTESIDDKQVPLPIKDLAAGQFPPNTRLSYGRKTTVVYEARGTTPEGKGQLVSITPAGRVMEKRDLVAGENDESEGAVGGFGAGQPTTPGRGPMRTLRNLPSAQDPTQPNQPSTPRTNPPGRR